MKQEDIRNEKECILNSLNTEKGLRKTEFHSIKKKRKEKKNFYKIFSDFKTYNSIINLTSILANFYFVL